MSGQEPSVEAFDVVVVGGGSGGIGAAIGAARAGASVHLIERYPFLGGAATASSVLSYCGFFDQRRELVVAGVGGDLLARLRAGGSYQEITFRWSGNTVVMIDPEYTKLTLDRMVADAGVSLGPAQLSGGGLTRTGGASQSCRHPPPASCERMRPRASSTPAATATSPTRGGEVGIVPLEERQAATLSMRIGGVDPMP